MPVSSSASVSSRTSNSSLGRKHNGVPKPMPMAVMRNAHEAIRGTMQDIQDHLDKDDFESARELWHRFHKYNDLHMKMEEGRRNCNARGLFRLVDDHADQAAKKAGLRDHHSNLYELEEDVVDIFEKAPDEARAKEVFPIFRHENEYHLKEEEDILMPAIQKMIKMKVPVKKYIQTDILPVLLAKEGDMEFFVRFSNEILQKHDTEPDKPRVRVFDHALWALASKEEWTEWNAWIQDTLEPGKYEEVTMAIEAFKEEQQVKKRLQNSSTPPVKDVITEPAKSPKRNFLQKIFAKTQ